MTDPAADATPAGHPPFTGLILAGGRSRRMGTDKAFLEIGGAPLVARLDGVLRAAGAAEVMVIGGDLERAAGLGLDTRPDRHPGEGPLGGLLTGWHVATTDLAFVTACDHPDLPAALPSLLSSRSVVRAADAWVPVVEGVRQVLAALHHRRSIDALTEQFERGERSLQRALRSLDVDEIHDLDPRWFVDLDTVDDVDRFLDGRRDTSG